MRLWSTALVFQMQLCFVIGGSGSSNILPEARISFLDGLFPATPTLDVPFVADLTSKQDSNFSLDYIPFKILILL